MFTVDGEEITQENFQEMVVETGMSIVFSMGEDFIARDKPKLRHARFGEFKFTADVLDMTPSERNSLNPIVAEGYAHTRTAPFCRTRGEASDGVLSVYDDNYKPAARNAAHFALKVSQIKPYTPPNSTKYKDIPNVCNPGEGDRGMEAPTSDLQAMLNVHRNDEIDALGSVGKKWEPEATTMSDIQNL